jgi:hypothetical protein
MHKVFISYSRADLRQVWPLASALRDAGLETWLDFEDLKPGEKWKDAILAALATANAMVFCLSPMSIESSWTSVELKLAAERNLSIIPVMVRRVSPSALPPRLQDVQLLDMERWPADEAPWHAAREVLTALGLRTRVDELQRSSVPCETLWISVGERALRPSDLIPVVEQCVPLKTRYWHVKNVTDSNLSEMLVVSGRVGRAVIVLDGPVEAFVAHSIVGAVAARVGEWRLTVIECYSERTLETCAALCRAHYLPVLWGKVAG